MTKVLHAWSSCGVGGREEPGVEHRLDVVVGDVINVRRPLPQPVHGRWGRVEAHHGDARTACRLGQGQPHIAQADDGQTRLVDREPPAGCLQACSAHIVPREHAFDEGIHHVVQRVSRRLGPARDLHRGEP